MRSSSPFYRMSHLRNNPVLEKTLYPPFSKFLEGFSASWRSELDSVIKLQPKGGQWWKYPDLSTPFFWSFSFSWNQESANWGFVVKTIWTDSWAPFTSENQLEVRKHSQKLRDTVVWSRISFLKNKCKDCKCALWLKKIIAWFASFLPQMHQTVK